MVSSAAPGDDFYRFVNHDWIAGHPLPPDKRAIDVFDELNDITEERLRSLAEEAVRDTAAEPGSPTRKIGDLYRSGMDTGSIEQQGLAPIQAELDRIDAMHGIPDVQRCIARLVSCGVAPCFSLSAEIDPKNSTMMIAGLSQGGLGLPNKVYYFREDTGSEQIRTRYRTHITTMLALSGIPAGAARDAAGIIFDLEKRLAGVSFSPEQNRDPEATYHKMTRDDLERIAPDMDWDAFFSAVGCPEIRELNVHQPGFFSGLGGMLAAEPVDTWRIFLRWKVISALAPFLDARFEEENFAFYGRILNGQPGMKPRWKRVLATVNYALGDAIGRMYVDRYFPPEAKDRMRALVENLKETFRSRVGNLSWMSPETRDAALQKLSRMELKIGYPETWQEYHDLATDSGSYVMNAIRAMEFDFRKGPNGMDRAGKPVDRTLWYMYPQTVNAYYDPGLNEIVFPAAILQPPFFGMDAGDAANYGAIGAIIGHEMTHGFDDTGRKYDKDGNLHDWWTAEDAGKFSALAGSLAEQYSAEVVLPGLPANGLLTLGEDIADLGGLTIAFHAFADRQKKPRDPGDLRQFFLSYATIWRENIRPEALRNQVLTDVHAPNPLRVNCVVFNMPEFYAAFPEISPASRLYRPPEKRMEIW